MASTTYPVVTDVSKDIDEVLQSLINDYAYKLYGVPESPAVFAATSNITREVLMSVQQRFVSYATEQMNILLNMESDVYSRYTNTLVIDRVFVRRGGPDTITTGVDLSISGGDTGIDDYFTIQLDIGADMTSTSDIVIKRTEEE